MLTHAPWQANERLRHGFLDAADAAVAPEWQRATGAPVFLPRQVHGVVVVAAGTTGPPPTADAVVTQPGQQLAGILTADCVPVLLLDRKERAAAAVHAGWRGAAAGVVEAAIAALGQNHGVAAPDLDAVIGPAIGPCCYQVGGDVRPMFEQRTGQVTAPAWDERATGLFLDLRTAVRCLLVSAQVREVTLVGGCTRCDGRFHSYRRDGKNAGRQLSFIGWAP